MGNSVRETLDYERLELVLERELYARSYYEFYKAAFAQLHPGKEYDENWHAPYICGKLEALGRRVAAGLPREKHLIINVPFRASKSMMCTVIFPVWCWAVLSARLKFISVSFSADLALQHSRRSRDLIEGKWFQRLYGDVVKIRPDVNAAGHYETVDGGMRKAVGTGAMITGSGADIQLIDDPQDPKRAFSEVERASVIEYKDLTLASRFEDLAVGTEIIVQQRLHEQDVTGHLLDPKDGNPAEYEHVCIPAEYDAQVVSPPELKEFYVDGLFWPTRFAKKILDYFKRTLGSLGASGQLQQRPVPPEGNLFKRKWFEVLDPKLQVRDPTASPIHFVIDTAFTEDEQSGNDPTGILAFYRTPDGNLVVVNFTQVWLEFPELLRFIVEYLGVNHYSGHSTVLIEPKANGKSVAQTLRKLRLKDGSALNVVEVAGEYLKDDKVTRANGVSPTCQAGRVRLLAGEWNDLFVGQLASFPRAAHDEAVDVLVYAVNYFVQPASDFLAAWI